MADRKPRRQDRDARGSDSKKPDAKAGENTEDRVTKARMDAEKDVGALDNPDVPEEPSELRHVAYFVGVIAFALVLNFLAMLLVSGGQ